MDFRLPGHCWSSAGNTGGIRWLAAVIPIATCLVMPGGALASSAIDASNHSNLLLYGWFIALVFLVFVFLVSQRAIRNRRMAVAAVRWPTTAGKVISAEVTKRVREGEVFFDYFIPQVRYEYEANGVRRQCDVIRIGLDNLTCRQEKNANDHIALYPVGTAITVHYDPKNPEHAALEIGQMGFSRMMLACTFFAGLGIAMFLIAIWSASHSSS